MPYGSIVWDLDDDPDGDVPHRAGHGVSKGEVEDVLQKATDADLSRSSGRPVGFGDAGRGRHLMVVYEEIDEDTAYPITAYEVPRRRRPSSASSASGGSRPKRPRDTGRSESRSPRNCPT